MEPQLLNQAAGKANWDFCQNVTDYDDMRQNLDTENLATDEVAEEAELDMGDKGAAGEPKAAAAEE